MEVKVCENLGVVKVPSSGQEIGNGVQNAGDMRYDGVVAVVSLMEGVEATEVS